MIKVSVGPRRFGGEREFSLRCNLWNGDVEEEKKLLSLHMKKKIFQSFFAFPFCPCMQAASVGLLQVTLNQRSAKDIPSL